MDNWIPTICGVRSTQLIKSNLSSQMIPIIFFSAHNDVRISKNALTDDYLAKPFDLIDLENKVHNLLDSKKCVFKNAFKNSSFMA